MGKREDNLAGWPCIWLVHWKFESANQDSAGRKIFTVLMSMQDNRKGIEFRQLSSWEMVLDLQFQISHQIV